MSPQPAAPPISEPVAAASGQRRSRLAVLASTIVLLLALVVASAWLIVPYLAERNLFFALDPEAEEEQYQRAINLFEFLLHDGPGPGDVEVVGFYATPTYYAYPGFVADVAEYRPDRYLVFVVSEAVHVLDLPQEPPTANLIVDGVAYSPVDIDGPRYPEHHRDTYVRFAKHDGAGEPVIKESTTRIELRASALWSTYRTESQERSVTWDLPITYPPETLPPDMRSPAVLASFATGLTAVLAPFLLPMPILFLATVIGIGGTQAVSGATSNRHLMRVAFAFAGGLILLAAVAGGLVGTFGEAGLAFSGEWNRQVSIVAGILVIVLGLWLLIRARRAPTEASATPARADLVAMLGAAAIAVCFSVGGVAGFDGALAAIVIIQLAAAGGVGPAALAMLVVSAIVAVPLLLGGWLAVRLLPKAAGRLLYARQLAIPAAAVVVVLGGVVVLDNLPMLVDLLYPPLGLK